MRFDRYLEAYKRYTNVYIFLQNNCNIVTNLTHKTVNDILQYTRSKCEVTNSHILIQLRNGIKFVIYRS